MSPRPSVWLLIGGGIWVANLAFGPYQYQLADGRGAAFFATSFLTLLVGILYTERRVSGAVTFYHTLTPRGEAVLRVGMLGFVAATAASVYYIVALSGAQFGGGLAGIALARHSLTRADAMGLEIQRTWWSAIAQLLAYGGIGAMFVVGALATVHRKRTVWLAVLCLLGPIVVVLVQGGRNPAAFAVAGLGALLLMRLRRRLRPFFGMRSVKWFLAATGLVVLYLMIALFAWRSGTGPGTQLDVQESPYTYTNRALLRPFYEDLNRDAGGTLAPFYELSWYYSHSIAAFDALYARSSYREPGMGMFNGRIISIAAERIGLPVTGYLDLISSQPLVGLYHTGLQGFLLDFGEYLALPFVFLFGLAAGWLYTLASTGSLVGLAALPIINIWMFIYPVFNPGWGFSDFALFFALVLSAMLTRWGMVEVRGMPEDKVRIP